MVTETQIKEERRKKRWRKEVEKTKQRKDWRPVRVAPRLTPLGTSRK
jgi:hypothetical protein